LTALLADLKEEEALEITRKRLDAGDDPLQILRDSQRGMEIVGERFSRSEYLIPDLVYSGEILKQITEMVKPGITGTTEQKFVDKIEEVNPEMVGLSGFLTLAFDSMKATIDAIKEAGLRDNVEIMIGGGQIDDEIRKYTGADACRPDTVSAVALAKEWLGCK